MNMFNNIIAHSSDVVSRV